MPTPITCYDSYSLANHSPSISLTYDVTVTYVSYQTISPPLSITIIPFHSFMLCLIIIALPSL
jgi:hypothetical protein